MLIKETMAVPFSKMLRWHAFILFLLLVAMNSAVAAIAIFVGRVVAIPAGCMMFTFLILIAGLIRFTANVIAILLYRPTVHFDGGLLHVESLAVPEEVATLPACQWYCGTSTEDTYMRRTMVPTIDCLIVILPSGFRVACGWSASTRACWEELFGQEACKRIELVEARK